MKIKRISTTTVLALALSLGGGICSTALAAIKPSTPASLPVVVLKDGQILFTSTRDGGDRDIFIAGSDGSQAQNLTRISTAEDYDPWMREDGDLIFFASTRAGGDADIFVMNADGSKPRNLTAGSTATDESPTVTGVTCSPLPR